MAGNGYKDLKVWQKSLELAVLVYGVTQKFPQEERYGIVSQMRRSVVSISSNIAEGSKRGTPKDFKQFLRIALGSGAELETQFEISSRLGFLGQNEYNDVNIKLEEIMKMLTVFISRI